MEPSAPQNDASNETSRRLEERYAEIARLAGGLAHEVKNPLSTIRLNMGLLEEDVEELQDAPQQRRALKRIETVKRECSRLEDLLNEFLNFTRAHNLELTAANANDELKNVVDFFRPQANDSKIELLEYYSNDLPTIRVDKRSFDRAILNLLLNAQQAILARRFAKSERRVGDVDAPDSQQSTDSTNPTRSADSSDAADAKIGEILVRTRPCGAEVAVDLIDSGCGMDDETLARIFEPFYSTKRGGTGLGLPTVRKIVEGHGGRIAVQSEPGQGTQFTLTFPAIPRISAADPTRAVSNGEPPNVAPDDARNRPSEAETPPQSQKTNFP